MNALIGADDLARLAAYTGVKRLYVIPRVVILSIKFRAPDQLLPGLASQIIYKLRQDVKSSGDRRQVGLLEFDLGLAQMSGGHYKDAATQMADAAQTWNLTGNQPLVCLAYFAFGLTSHHSGNLQQAATGYGAAKRHLAIVEQDLKKSLGAGTASSGLQQYVQEIAKQLTGNVANLLNLSTLLRELPLERQYFSMVDVIEEISRQKPGKPLPQAVTDDIEENRRIVRKSTDLAQLGLFEFEIGLEHLSSFRYDEAVKQFSEANQQWTFAGERAFCCLARFARGFARYAQTDYEQAAHDFLKVRQEIASVISESHVLPPSSVAVRYQAFAGKLAEKLDLAIILLKEQRKPAVATPIIEPDLEPVKTLTLHFEFQQAITITEIRETVMLILQAFSQLNIALIRLEGSTDFPELETVISSTKQVLDAILEGFAANAVQAILSISGDTHATGQLGRKLKEWQEAESKLAAALSRDPKDKDYEMEVQQLGQKIDGLRQEISDLVQIQVDALIIICAPPATTAANKKIAGDESLPALRLILEYIAKGILTVT